MESQQLKIEMTVLYEGQPPFRDNISIEDRENNGNQFSKLEIFDPSLEYPPTYVELWGNPHNLILKYASIKEKIIGPYFSFPEFRLLTNDEATKRFSALKILESESDNIWLIKPDSVELITKEGKIVKSFIWPHSFHTIAHKGMLCAIKSDKRSIVQLNSSGEITEYKMNVSFGPFEELIAFDKQQALTIEGHTLRVYSMKGLMKELTISTCGIIEQQRPFMSYSKETYTYLYLDGRLQKWRIPPGIGDNLPIVGRRENYYIAYHRGYYCEFHTDSDTASNIQKMNENTYKNLVEPYHWRIAETRFVMPISPTECIISTSMISNVALITLKF